VRLSQMGPWLSQSGPAGSGEAEADFEFSSHHVPRFIPSSPELREAAALAARAKAAEVCLGRRGCNASLAVRPASRGVAWGVGTYG
jgi:hypothetical protein